MPLLTRKRLLLSKAESTYGTSSSPAGTDAILASALEVEPLQMELVDRELLQSYLGNSSQIVAQRAVSINCSVEVAGSGTAGTAPQWGSLMKACGFSETIVASTSVTYAPVSTSFSSTTLAFFNDGMRHLVVGCRGTVGFELTAGEIPRLNFEMMGIYATPTDTANPAVTYSNQAAPLAVNADSTTSVSVHSFSGCMQAFSMDVANEMVYRQLAGCTKQVLITQRAPAGEITIELPTIASKDFWTIASNQTQGSISWVHGTTAGNIATFTAGNCALGAPSLEDGDGIQHIQLPFRPIPSSSGNDEFTLVLT